MGHNKKLGDWGEKVAVTKLEADGYKILQQNWRCREGEIDVVAQIAETIVFVEVKTRKGQNAGLPEEAITQKKAQKLILLANLYLADHELDDVDWRIDVMAVELDKSGKLIRGDQIENGVMGW